MDHSDPLVQDAPPELTDDEAAEIARAVFGITATARSLGSNQDRNFVLRAEDAGPFLLKVANPATRREELEAQSVAAARIAASRRVRVPQALALADGSTARALTVGGRRCHARMLDFLEGATLSGSRHLSHEVVRALGRLAASVDRALSDLDHPGAERDSQWDLRHSARVLDELLPSVDEPLRSALAGTAASATEALDVVRAHLPLQVIHGDLTDDNVVTGPNSIPDGVIDLGDLCRSWRAAEIAVTVSSLLHHDGVTPADAVQAIAAYHEILPLTDAELDALWPLVALRAAVLVASAYRVLQDDPGNAYAAENLEHEQAILAAATSLPLAVGTALVRRAVGAAARELAPAEHVRLVDGIAASAVVSLDLSATSPALDEGRWLADDAEDALAAEALAAGASLVVTRFGERRLTRSRAGAAEPENVTRGIDLFSVAPVELRAPWAGTVRRMPDGFRLVGAGIRLTVRLVTPEIRTPEGAEVPESRGAADRAAPPFLSCAHADGATVAAAEPLGAFCGRIEVGVDDGTEVPAAVCASVARAWRAVAADPSPLVPGARTAPPAEDPAALLALRDAHLAPVQEHYFASPPVMVRGWREFLVDADARVYVDALNNVTAIGHAHPRLVEAVAAQWRLLNTNSRFHYPAIARFAERLAGLLPDGLDQVFLVNSGSEAVDLALRLARAHTGRRDVLTIREAYHGWTDLSDAVSTSIADNPGALSSRPEWVHPVDSPDPHRGPHRDDPSRYAREAVAEVERLAAAGRPPGAFLAESVFGNAGGMALPEGYLEAVATAVRSHGGVHIADEVQVGYGRLGRWFWGFEQQGVVPDIVAVAKAMGNGHPLGAVVTTRAIAEDFAKEGPFFSSAGGSPVSSVVGLTVLDVIEDERLQQNAREVGEHFADRLRALAVRHPNLGAVHGFGLYLGPEIVDGHGGPGTAEARAICERMRRMGIMIQPTGDHKNVLKIKPPLCLDRASADLFVDTLDHVLTTGW